MARDIAVDGAGNFYITGDTDSFDGVINVFIVRFFSNGTLDWNRTWGGSASDYGRGVTFDESQDCIYATGNTKSYGPGGKSDVFLQKYYINGSQGWNDTWGAPDGDWGEAVTTDDSGNIYLTGWSDVGGPNLDAFTAKYYPSGTRDWTRYWVTTSDDHGEAIAVDVAGNTYITGYTYGGAGSDNSIIVKYDATGTFAWDEMVLGAGIDYNYGIDVDAGGSVYVTGKTTTFGAGGENAYIAKRDSNGNLCWHVAWGGDNDDGGTGILVDGAGNLYVGGRTGSLGLGGGDVFLAKYKLHQESTGFSPSPPIIPGFSLPLVLVIVVCAGTYLAWRKRR